MAFVGSTNLKIIGIRFNGLSIYTSDILYLELKIRVFGVDYDDHNQQAIFMIN